ncbi:MULTISPECIES: GerAB/ArcD/ProY family transporter [unclassified Candidatus Frackibacter]|uniref:GerAB/ArcD/ProY family transporter n=1 Tax=unclassified Candidatus Frackibacter TaxID=2648818 RepID=UPI00079C2A4B|nr:MULTISPECIES: endospore germination permease [unclassified Candidatus Frackibacter]KXS42150.1 MAG: spore germination protein [Candidatus Frackibacter sp. T328-2]
MINPDDRISTRQLYIMVISILIGVNTLIIPRLMTSVAGVDGWILPITSGIVVIINMYLLIRINSAFPNLTFIEYSEIILGKFIGKILSLGLLLYFLFLTSINIRLFSSAIKPFLIPQTPIEVLLLSTLIMPTYLIRHGVEPIARFNEYITIPALASLAMPLFLIISIPYFDLGKLLPFFSSGIYKIAQGSLIGYGASAFLGLGMMYLLYPYIKSSERDNIYSSVIMGIITVIVIFVLFIIMTIAAVGAVELSYMTWPIISILGSIEVPVVERVGSLFIAIWATISFTTTLVLTFVGNGLGLAHFLNYREFKHLILPGMVPPYFLALLPGTIDEVLKVMYYINYIGKFYLIFLPLILFVVFKIRNLDKYGRKSNKKEQ